MYLDYNEYKELGYSAIPEAGFERWAMIAENLIRKLTQNRITDSDLRPQSDADEETKRVAKMNQLGVCEISELYYLGMNPQTDAATARQPLVGYRNADYSESYLGRDRGDVSAAAPDSTTIFGVMQTYFTDAQLFRGVDR